MPGKDLVQSGEDDEVDSDTQRNPGCLQTQNLNTDGRKIDFHQFLVICSDPLCKVIRSDTANHRRHQGYFWKLYELVVMINMSTWLSRLAHRIRVFVKPWWPKSIAQ